MAKDFRNFVATTRTEMANELEAILQGKMVITLEGHEISTDRTGWLKAHIEHADLLLDGENDAHRT